MVLFVYDTLLNGDMQNVCSAGNIIHLAMLFCIGKHREAFLGRDWGRGGEECYWGELLFLFR